MEITYFLVTLEPLVLCDCVHLSLYDVNGTRDYYNSNNSNNNNNCSDVFFILECPISFQSDLVRNDKAVTAEHDGNILSLLDQ
jgi:hypothetical protein